MLSREQRFLKRSFDIIVSVIGVVLMVLPILLLIFLASISTKKTGLFLQKRIGRNGSTFLIYKVRSMKGQENNLNIFSDHESRITHFGRFLRKTHLDELPQLINILKGDMSFVGPRPDIPGYADQLQGEDRIILSVRPGLTGPATLKFRNENVLLAQVEDPQIYNDEIIWPEKVAINKSYVQDWTFYKDLKYLFLSIFPKFVNF